MESTAAPRPRRRWLQFSLKSFLVLLTVFGVWLGVVVNQANRQRRAVEALREMGWYVAYEDIDDPRLLFTDTGVEFVDNPDSLPWRHRVFGRDFFSDVVEVRPYFVKGFDGDYLDLSKMFPEHYPHRELSTILEPVAQLTQVTTLQLDALPVGDDSIAFLRDFTNLDYLGLSQTKVTDAGLSRLARMDRLRDLDLSQTSITDAGLEHLQELKNLVVLDLQGTDVTETGVAQLQQALPQCLIKSGGRRTWRDW